MFCFHQFRYIFEGTEEVNSCFVSSPSDPTGNVSHLRKYSRLEGMFEFIEKFCRELFPLVFHGLKNNCLFLIFNETSRISSCTNCLIGNSDTPISLSMKLIDLLGSLLLIARISSINSVVTFSSEQWVRLSRCRNFVITTEPIQLFLHPQHSLKLTPKHWETYLLMFTAWMTVSTAYRL